METIRVQLFVRGSIYTKSISWSNLGDVISNIKDESSLDLSETIIVEGDMDISNCDVQSWGIIACTGTLKASVVSPPKWELTPNSVDTSDKPVVDSSYDSSDPYDISSIEQEVMNNSVWMGLVTAPDTPKQTSL